MERFESILISYENENRILYQGYAEFLRLMGIYVCEDVICDQDAETEKTSWKDSDFSLHYTIDCSEQWDMTDDGVKNSLTFFRHKLSANIKDKWFFECYDYICNLYVKYHLLQAATVLYYYKMNEDEVAKSGDLFEKAADELTELLKSKPEFMENRFVRYANLYCKQKANSARHTCEKRLVYYVDKLVTQGLLITGKFADFSNAWVLLGLICEKSNDFLLEAVDAYRRAIRMLDDRPYASSVYYRLGKCYEAGERKITQRAKKQYENAYRTVKKYRNVYKLAVSCRDEGNLAEAVRYFTECLKYLKNRSFYLNPIEQEYYFKVNVQISYCYLQSEDFYEALKYADRALDFRKRLEAGLEKENLLKKFFREMYGKEAEKYVCLTLKRMNDKQIRRYQMVARMELRTSEEKEENLELIHG